MSRYAVSSDDDDALIRAARGGDQMAFALLLRRHRDWVLRLLYAIVKNRDASEDLTQEVFLRRLRWRPHYKVTHSPSLLFRIARNLLIDRARRHQRKAGTCVPFEEVGTPIPSRESSPDQILELRERLDCIRQAIEGLSERCREVFILHRFGGLSYEEIAVRLGLSPSTVEKHMIRAIATCKAGVEQLDH